MASKKKKKRETGFSTIRPSLLPHRFIFNKNNQIDEKGSIVNKNYIQTQYTLHSLPFPTGKNVISPPLKERYQHKNTPKIKKRSTPSQNYILPPYISHSLPKLHTFSQILRHKKNPKKPISRK